MEIHVQQCQSCEKRNLRNVLVREPGENDKVYVQCRSCGAFVASYTLSPMGYYHHGKGYESFLRSVQRSGEFMSGRNIAEVYKARVAKEERHFRNVLDRLEKRNQKREEQQGKSDLS